MNTILDTNDFGNFLAETVFHEKLKNLRKIKRGGTSINYKAETSSDCYLIKAIPFQNDDRASRLCNILVTLNKYPDFCTAHLYKQSKPLTYKNFTIMVINFIKGKKLKYFELNANLIHNIFKNYCEFQKIRFVPENIIYPMRNTIDLYNANKHFLQKINLTAKPYQRNIIRKISDYNTLFYNTTPHLNKEISIIHGDASLNNMLFSNKGDVYFLDLELIRYGYMVEDAAELLLSALLPHYIFKSPQKRLMHLTNEINSVLHFSKDEWIYGICHHFLYLTYRRLRGSKLFNSYRKDWLLLQYLKKFSQIIQLIDTQFNN